MKPLMCVTIQMKAAEQYFAVQYCRTVTDRQEQLTDLTLRTTVSIANAPYSEHIRSVHLIITSAQCVSVRTIHDTGKTGTMTAFITKCKIGNHSIEVQY